MRMRRRLRRMSALLRRPIHHADLPKRRIVVPVLRIPTRTDRLVPLRPRARVSAAAAAAARYPRGLVMRRRGHALGRLAPCVADQARAVRLREHRGGQRARVRHVRCARPVARPRKEGRRLTRGDASSLRKFVLGVGCGPGLAIGRAILSRPPRWGIRRLRRHDWIVASGKRQHVPSRRGPFVSIPVGFSEVFRRTLLTGERGGGARTRLAGEQRKGVAFPQELESASGGWPDMFHVLEDLHTPVQADACLGVIGT